MSVERLEALYARIEELDRKRRKLTRQMRKLERQADAIGAIRYCVCCAQKAVETDGLLPSGWTVHAIGDKRSEHEYFCPQHVDDNPDAA